MAAKSEFYEIDTGVAEVLHEPDGSMVLLVNGVPSSHIVPGDPERLDFEYMRWIADFLDSAYPDADKPKARLLSLIHISEPTRLHKVSRMPSSA